jgi:DNA-binding NarL/FixJ family response regulator
MENEIFTLLDKEDFRKLRERLSVSANVRTDLDYEFMVEEVMKKLTSRQSYILIKVMEDKKLQEIAARLSISKSTVSLEISKIRKTLKNINKIE